MPFLTNEPSGESMNLGAVKILLGGPWLKDYTPEV